MSKAVSYKVEGSKLIVTVDTDGDGAPVLKIELELTEVLGEVAALFAKKV